MSKDLAMDVARRFKSGACVVIIREADEYLATQAVIAGAKAFGSIKVVSSAADECMDALGSHATGSGVLIIPDCLKCWGGNPQAVRWIREVALQDREPGEPRARLVLIEHPATEVDASLFNDCDVLMPTLPSIPEIKEELEDFCLGMEFKLDDDEAAHEVATAVAGLPRHEVSRLFSRCFLRPVANPRAGMQNEDGDDEPPTIAARDLDAGWLRVEKAEKITDRLGGAIVFEKTNAAPVGGLDLFKKWLKPRQDAFGSAKAKEFGLPESKGVLAVGVPGCGKSLMAKDIAASWKLPLLRLDMGKVYGSLVGQSEAQARGAIEAAEACAPCVLWIDEIEKGIAGSDGGGGDGGTGQRVFGTLLTWLQEKTAPVFVVATANRIAGLPPELLRKGRFDEIFFVGLPNVTEREQIAEIHLARRKRTIKGAPKKIAQASAGFSGAEIEEAVVTGLFEAYSAGRDLKTADVVDAIKATSPLSKTRASEIEALKKWADGRARPASSASDAKTNTNGRRRRPSLN